MQGEKLLVESREDGVYVNTGTKVTSGDDAGRKALGGIPRGWCVRQHWDKGHVGGRCREKSSWWNPARMVCTSTLGQRSRRGTMQGEKLLVESREDGVYVNT